MTSCSFAWLSVIVKCGLSGIVSQKLVKIGWESNFGELLMTVKVELDRPKVERCLQGILLFLKYAHEQPPSWNAFLYFSLKYYAVHPTHIIIFSDHCWSLFVYHWEVVIFDKVFSCSHSLSTFSTAQYVCVEF